MILTFILLLFKLNGKNDVQNRNSKSAHSDSSLALLKPSSSNLTTKKTILLEQESIRSIKRVNLNTCTKTAVTEKRSFARKQTNSRMKKTIMSTNNQLVTQVDREDALRLMISKLHERFNMDKELDRALEENIESVANKIEKEMFDQLKSRVIYFNRMRKLHLEIINPKNLTFIRKILNGDIKPSELPKMPNNLMEDESVQTAKKLQELEEARLLTEHGEQSKQEAIKRLLSQGKEGLEQIVDPEELAKVRDTRTVKHSISSSNSEERISQVSVNRTISFQDSASPVSSPSLVNKKKSDDDLVKNKWATFRNEHAKKSSDSQASINNSDSHSKTPSVDKTLKIPGDNSSNKTSPVKTPVSTMPKNLADFETDRSPTEVIRSPIDATTNPSQRINITKSLTPTCTARLITTKRLSLSIDRNELTQRKINPDDTDKSKEMSEQENEVVAENAFSTKPLDSEKETNSTTNSPEKETSSLNAPTSDAATTNQNKQTSRITIEPIKSVTSSSLSNNTVQIDRNDNVLDTLMSELKADLIKTQSEIELDSDETLESKKSALMASIPKRLLPYMNRKLANEIPDDDALVDSNFEPVLDLMDLIPNQPVSYSTSKSTIDLEEPAAVSNITVEVAPCTSNQTGRSEDKENNKKASLETVKSVNDTQTRDTSKVDSIKWNGQIKRFSLTDEQFDSINNLTNATKCRPPSGPLHVDAQCVSVECDDNLADLCRRLIDDRPELCVDFAYETFSDKKPFWPHAQTESLRSAFFKLQPASSNANSDYTSWYAHLLEMADRFRYARIQVPEALRFDLRSIYLLASPANPDPDSWKKYERFCGTRFKRDNNTLLLMVVPHHQLNFLNNKHKPNEHKSKHHELKRSPNKPEKKTSNEKVSKTPEKVKRHTVVCISPPRDPRKSKSSSSIALKPTETYQSNPIDQQGSSKISTSLFDLNNQNSDTSELTKEIVQDSPNKPSSTSSEQINESQENTASEMNPSRRSKITIVPTNKQISKDLVAQEPIEIDQKFERIATKTPFTKEIQPVPVSLGSFYEPKPKKSVENNFISQLVSASHGQPQSSEWLKSFELDFYDDVFESSGDKSNRVGQKLMQSQNNTEKSTKPSCFHGNIDKKLPESNEKISELNDNTTCNQFELSESRSKPTSSIFTDFDMVSSASESENETEEGEIKSGNTSFNSDKSQSRDKENNEPPLKCMKMSENQSDQQEESSTARRSLDSQSTESNRYKRAHVPFRRSGGYESDYRSSSYYNNKYYGKRSKKWHQKRRGFRR